MLPAVISLRALLLCLALALFAAAARADVDPRVRLTEEERAWLAAHPVITFGPDPNWPPYESFDEDGNFQGICADHMKLIADRLGVTFRFVKLKNWSTIVEDAKKREIDCYTTAVATPERETYMLFTKPHVTQPGVILTRTDAPPYKTFDDLSGKRLCIVAGYWWEEELARTHPQIKQVSAPDIATGLGMLSFGSVDAMINDPATSSYYIHELGITNVKIAARTPGETKLSMGVRKDWPLLQSILDKALATITKEEFDAIEKRWVGFDISEPESEFPWFVLGLIVVVAAALVWAGFAGRRLLKDRIAQQTEQLRAELEQREDVHRAIARTTVEITSAATELAASARAQAGTADAFEASAASAAGAVDAIGGTLETLLRSVESLTQVAQRTAERAEAGRAQLEQLDRVMGVMEKANERMGERVTALQESADKIQLATTTMVKVVDQTNLLSVNSAIEAEKAGEHGRGFGVVAQEIQRLADQSADATLQIDGIVRDMQEGVAAGVREAAEAHEQVRGGVDQAERIGAELGAIMAAIGTLTSRFEEIRDLVTKQSRGTETIDASIREVEGGAQAVSASSTQLADVSQTLQHAIDALRAEVENLEGEASE